jgi:hypothetical protein
MEPLGPLAVLTSAVFGSWVILELRGGHQRKKRSQISRYVTFLLVLLGLVTGWLVQISTGNFVILIIVGLAILITVFTELSRLF